MAPETRSETGPEAPPEHPSEAEEERPPLGSWPRLYAVVVGNLFLIIFLLILFTRAVS